MRNSNDDPHPNRRERLAEQLFTGVNMAVFLVLISCVAAAAVLWDRWH
jgi:hypothetical protein